MGGRMRRRTRVAVAIAVSAISLGLGQQSALADPGPTGALSAVAATGSTVSGTVSAATGAGSNVASQAEDLTSDVTSDAAQAVVAAVEGTAEVVADTSDIVSDAIDAVGEEVQSGVSTAGAVVEDTTSAAEDAVSVVTSAAGVSAPNPAAVVSDPVSASAPTQIVGQAVGGTEDGLIPAEGTPNPTRPSPATSPASGAGSSTNDQVRPSVTAGMVQEREGGASALAFGSGGDLLALREAPDLCTGPGGNSQLCLLSVGLNNGSLAEAVTSIVRRLAQTGLELLPVIALGLALAAIGALALATAGRRSDEPSLPTATFGDAVAVAVADV